MIAENLTRLMAERDLDAEQLATRAQVDHRNLGAYLADQARPCPLEQRRLALALGIPVEELYADTWATA